MLLKVTAAGAPTTSHHSPCGTRTRSPRASCCAPRPRVHGSGPSRSSPASSCGTSSVRRPASSPRSTHRSREAPHRDPPTARPRSPRRRNTIARRPSGVPSNCSTAAPRARSRRLRRPRRVGPRAPARVVARRGVVCFGRGRVLDSSKELRRGRRDHSRRHARPPRHDVRGHAWPPRRRGRRRWFRWWRVWSQARGPAGQSLLFKLASEALPCHGAGCPPPRAGCPKVLSRTRLRVGTPRRL